MSILKKINYYSEKIILSLLMITMCILIITQVISRYVFQDSITWTEEASRYLFIWLIFLSIGIGFKEQKHISIDFLTDMFSPNIQKIFKQITYLLVLALSILFVWEGYVLISQMKMFGQTSANLQIPMWIIYLSLPVGFFLSTIRLIQTSIELWMPTKEGD